MARYLLMAGSMSHRAAAKPNPQATLPASLRAGLYDGVPTEASDRRAVAMLAFAIDEPEDPAGKTDAGDEGLVAFLPVFCSPRLSPVR